MPERKPSFVAYVDESGDEGFSFDRASSRWFVLAAAIIETGDDLTEVKLVDEVRAGINKNRKPEHQIPEKKPLHFRDLKHDQRKYFASRLGAARLRTVAICVHKPDLTSPEVASA